MTVKKQRSGQVHGLSCKFKRSLGNDIMRIRTGKHAYNGIKARVLRRGPQQNDSFECGELRLNIYCMGIICLTRWAQSYRIVLMISVEEGYHELGLDRRETPQVHMYAADEYNQV